MVTIVKTNEQLRDGYATWKAIADLAAKEVTTFKAEWDVRTMSDTELELLGAVIRSAEAYAEHALRLERFHFEQWHGAWKASNDK